MQDFENVFPVIAGALLSVFVFAIVVFASVAKVHAQDNSAARNACLPDYRAYCSSVRAGGGRVKKCLTDNLERLSPNCRSVVTAERNAGNNLLK